MKKLFTLLFALILTNAVQAQSYKVLNVNKKDGTTQTFKLSEIEKLTIVKVGTDPEIPESGDYVDLVLPSGTLWATRNVGALSPADYGNYFAWGETTPELKDNYDWSTYKWCKSQYYLTKYNPHSGYGIADAITELEPADDAATVNWGSAWCMPTKEQQEELCNDSYTTLTWTSMANSDGTAIWGWKVVSKTNGKYIFLPAAGYRYSSSLWGTGANGEDRHGFYWSKSLHTNDPRDAHNMDFYTSGSNYDSGMMHQWRYNGLPVRPVRASTK